MAVNLRNGLSPEYTLLICDVNKEAISKFQKQVAGKGPVKVINNGFEAANAAVSWPALWGGKKEVKRPSKKLAKLGFRTWSSRCCQTPQL